MPLGQPSTINQKPRTLPLAPANDTNLSTKGQHPVTGSPSLARPTLILVCGCAPWCPKARPIQATLHHDRALPVPGPLAFNRNSGFWERAAFVLVPIAIRLRLGIETWRPEAAVELGLIKTPTRLPGSALRLCFRPCDAASVYVALLVWSRLVEATLEKLAIALVIEEAASIWDKHDGMG